MMQAERRRRETHFLEIASPFYRKKELPRSEVQLRVSGVYFFKWYVFQLLYKLFDSLY